MILVYLSYISDIFLFESWLLHLLSFDVNWLSTVKVIVEFIKGFTFATSHCNRWYCIK